MSCSPNSNNTCYYGDPDECDEIGSNFFVILIDNMSPNISFVNVLMNFKYCSRTLDK